MTTDAQLDVIARAALLGTERGATRSWREGNVPTAVAPYLAQLDSGDAEGALLNAAALLGAYAAAGRLPSSVADPGAPAAPAPPDASDDPVAPSGPSRLLATMLTGVHAEALPEWLALTANRGWRVPTMSLPALLTLATATPALRSSLAAVLGARGRWLAAQRDDWQWAAHDTVRPPDGDALATAWQTGAPEERAELLERVRRADASRGRALLESTWDEEPPTQRAALLPRLAIALALADEPFLERALDDRRQEVRRAAAVLLAGLSGSALVARMTQRARAALRYDEGGLLHRARLHVEPPAAHDASMARDGVEKTSPAGTGERAWWLAQIVAAVPPAMWSTEWATEPTTLLRAALQTDWASSLLDGWGAAAVRFGDAAWAEALLAAPSERQATRLAPSRAALLAVLPPARREAIVAPALRGRAFDADLVELVVACMHPWSESFARAVLDWLRQRAARPAATHPDVSDWQLREVLPRLALFVPPSLAATAAERWPTDDEHGRAWERPVERFLSLLTFRNEIAEEFAR